MGTLRRKEGNPPIKEKRTIREGEERSKMITSSQKEGRKTSRRVDTGGGGPMKKKY